MSVIRNEELALARRAAADEEAFGELVSRYGALVYNVAYRSAADGEDAADIAQETFLKAWRSLPAFRGECALSTWLVRIALSCACDFARSKKRRATVSLITHEEEGEGKQIDLPTTDITSLPEEAALRREEIAAVREAIEALPEDYRQIVTMRDIGGMSYADIAAALSLELGTVKSRLFRARAAVKEFLIRRNFSPVSPSNKKDM